MTRSAALLFIAIALIVICLPAAAVSLGRSLAGPGVVQEPDPEPAEDTDHDKTPIRFYRVDLEQVVLIDLEEYLVGVVIAEMPASFGLEALKAQAVAARTYTLSRSRAWGGDGCRQSAASADICSDSTHCQAWIDPQEAVLSWPDEMKNENLARVRQAVLETAGEVITYQGRLIEAVYHSTCGGKTESSQAIWSGGPTPYLVSVQCPYCTHSPYYESNTLVPYAKLSTLFLQEPALPVAAIKQLPAQVVEETPGGRVGLLELGDSLLEGKEVRRLLDLPSTAFIWEAQEDGFLFTTHGHGHGVGLCQYGADGAAAEGKSYRQIISLYYPGTTVSQAD
ncbi:MAG: stage II sporulation protein D [Bacillota bacterium]